MVNYVKISDIIYNYKGWRAYFLAFNNELISAILKLLCYILWLNSKLREANYSIDLFSQSPLLKLLYGGVRSIEPLIFPEDVNEGLSIAGLHREIFNIKHYPSGKVEVKGIDIKEVEELINCALTYADMIYNKNMLDSYKLDINEVISKIDEEVKDWFTNGDKAPSLKYLYKTINAAIKFLPWFNPYSFLIMGLRIFTRVSLKYLGLSFDEIFHYKINDLSLSEILDIERVTNNLAIYRGLSEFRWSDNSGLGLTTYLLLGNVIGFIILYSSKLTRYFIGFEDVLRRIREFPNTLIINDKNLEDFIGNEVKDKDLLESINKLITGFKSLDPNLGLRLVKTKYIETEPSHVLMLIHLNIGNYFGNPIKLTYNPSYRTYTREFVGYSLIPYWHPTKWPELSINHGEFISRIKEVV